MREAERERDRENEGRREEGLRRSGHCRVSERSTGGSPRASVRLRRLLSLAFLICVLPLGEGDFDLFGF